MQLTWKVSFCNGSREHGTLGQFFLLLKRLPAAQKPKDDMHACIDALFTVLKGYIIAHACKELGIDMATESVPSRNEIMELQAKARLYCAAIYEGYGKVYSGHQSILCQNVEESGDKKHDYAHTLCHYASLALEFTDAWCVGLVICRLA